MTHTHIHDDAFQCYSAVAPDGYVIRYTKVLAK